MASILIMSHQLYADQVESPVNADWAVNALAPASADSNNAGLTVRSFDDTDEEGIGFTLLVPPNASSVVVTLVSRAEVAPGAPAAVVPRLYSRNAPDAAPVTAWSTGTDMTPVDLPTTEEFQYDDEEIALATLGLSAGQIAQFELTRNAGAGGDTLAGDWDLLLVRIEFVWEFP